MGGGGGGYHMIGLRDHFQIMADYTLHSVNDFNLVINFVSNDVEIVLCLITCLCLQNYQLSLKFAFFILFLSIINLRK